MKIDVRRGSPVETDRAAVLTRTLRRLGLAVGTSSPAGFSIAAAALVSALWIATCAVAPEFIWQGLKIFIGHATGADLLSALLIALIFVFFIEPVLERARSLLMKSETADETARPGTLLSSSALGLSFGFISVCLHDSMSAFVASGGASDGSGLHHAIRLAVGLAIVPFLVAVAWQSAHSRWLALPAGVVAALSSVFAGWMFGWSAETVVVTAIPGLVIQFWGYRRVAWSAEPAAHLVGDAAVVAIVAVVWLVLASIVDAILAAFDASSLALYSLPDLLVDARFYFGWALGLLLAPLPSNRVGGQAGLPDPR